MIGLMLIFTFTMYENLFYKSINQSKTRLYDYALMFFVAGVAYALMALLYALVMQTEMDVGFLYDWRFWLFTVVELLGMYTLNQNYINNPKNHTSINVGVFSTVLLTPVLVYFLDSIFGFGDTIKIDVFNNPLNIIIYILIYSVIGGLYFLPKIKTQEVVKLWMVGVTSISLLLAFYIEIKLLQTYEFNIMIYAVFDFTLALVYYINSVRGEVGVEKKPNRGHIKGGLVYSFFGMLHLVGLTIVAAEVGVLFRRVSQILAGIIADKKRQTVRDIVLVSFMVLGGMVLLYI